jgi:porin
MARSHLIFVAVMLALGTIVNAQTESGPAEDVEQITTEAQRAPDEPLTTLDRPIYRPLQDWKRELAEKYGIAFALENTTIYQTTSGGIRANDAIVNTLGLFATWKIFRSEDGKDFGGPGFQFETRGNHDGEFTELRDELGTLWSPNDSTSDAYTRINQLWWGQRFGQGRFGVQIGKIDPGSIINTNRFAGSGNTQYFGQPYATNPARSFPQNGLGLQLRAEPVEWLYFHFLMSDSDAISSHSPFTTIEGRWLYAGEVGFRPKFEGPGQGTYRFMLYHRETEPAHEFGWALSADQNLTGDYGVFLRYGGNDGDINAIDHLVAAGFSFLRPFDRQNDQAGIGVSYTHPSDDDLRDEYATETYYRLQLTEGIELSGSAQLIFDPSAGDRDTVAVFGLRLRILY